MIGLGNSLSRDDAFGSMALARLVQEPALPKDVDFTNADTDLLSVLEEFPKYSHVILVDALLDAEGKVGRPGTVIALEEEEFSAWPETSPGVHQFSPLVAVRLFRKLYPCAKTRVTLVAYCSDHIVLRPPGGSALDDRIIKDGVRLLLSLVQK